jgi:predicted ATP-binding protein involved in virulence
MRIDRINLKNFKCFSDREFQLHPQFNLIVGMNGTGKTSLLDALSVAVGAWFLGLRGPDSRHIRPSEVRLQRYAFEYVVLSDDIYVDHRWEHVYPCEISVYGEVQSQCIEWSRKLNSEFGRTTYGEAAAIKQAASEADNCVRKGEKVDLPLISYYGTGRLWQEPRNSFKIQSPKKAITNRKPSRFDGYANSVDPRLSVGQMSRWFAQQSWIAYQKKTNELPMFSAVKSAILSCIDGAIDMNFDAGVAEIVVDFHDSAQPFSNLSDGQRCMLAMIGDIAQKAVNLNPHFGTEVLARTKGVVLVDELDLHLHPRWQRRVIEDMRRIFPSIQFICTTHSPFLIQSLRSGEELLMLEGQPISNLENLSIDSIAEGIQGIDNPDVSERYKQMESSAKEYLGLVDRSGRGLSGDSEAVFSKLDEINARHAENPAFQAFLEMKRVAILGK